MPKGGVELRFSGFLWIHLANRTTPLICHIYTSIKLKEEHGDGLRQQAQRGPTRFGIRKEKGFKP